MIVILKIDDIGNMIIKDLLIYSMEDVCYDGWRYVVGNSICKLICFDKDSVTDYCRWWTWKDNADIKGK